MSDDVNDWKKIAAILNKALPEIDDMLSQENVPLSSRKRKAFDIIQLKMLKVSDYEAFQRSESYGKLLIIIGEWYRDRYGESVVDDDEGGFISTILVHGTPFAMFVPRTIIIPDDEPKMRWIAMPASVQPEEDVLNWIQGSVVGRLLENERLALKKSAKEIANLIRSIGFDLNALESDSDANIVKLAASVRSNLHSSARHLCDRSEGGLRMSAWDASQATEKALKILIRRKGGIPGNTHDLSKLANHSEALGCNAVDRTELSKIPSSRDATDLRYGGEIKLSQAVTAYNASLAIIKEVLLNAESDKKHNIREARIKLEIPPYFEFDIKKFRNQLRASPPAKE